jgi:hypothetical protein
MSDENSPLASATGAILVIFLSGLVVVLLALVIHPVETLFTVLLGCGTALIAASAVVAFERLVPPWEERIRLYRTHAEIYAQFERMLHGLGDGPHTVKTINSFLPAPETEKTWDHALTQYLHSHADTTFIRVIAAQDTTGWAARLKRITEHYGHLPNYHQHPCYVGDAVPPIEMFLVDGREVIMSFGTRERASPEVTFGIKLRDPQVCRQLEAYHGTLVSRFAREDLRQKKLPEKE